MGLLKIVMGTTRISCIVFFLLLGLMSFGQSTITIEVNWPNWSSENRVSFRSPSLVQIGSSICNPAACFDGIGNNSYSNSGSLATYTGISQGLGYSLLLEDDFGDAWNGAGSFVRVYQNGSLILTADLTVGSSTEVFFDIENDTDGDGIYDSVDIDDDNDGITDEEEYCTNANVAFFGSSNVGTRTVSFSHANTGYTRLDLTTFDNSFQITVNGTTVHNSILEFENGALGGGEIYTRFQSDNALIASPWVANSNGLPRLRLLIDESGTVSVFGSRTTGSANLEPMQAEGGVPFNTITWVSGTNSFTLVNQDGPGPESLNGTIFASAICDTDGDGLDNSLDLDSDNDGIYDIVESGVLATAGVNDMNNNGVIDGAPAAFGANGLFSNIENVDTAYADLNYSIADSDGDATYDLFELDADNDSCNDVNEAGYTDANSDGILGPLLVTVDSNGLVTSGSDGYTEPLDVNINAVYEFQEAGAGPTITTEPISIAVCPECIAQFEVIGLNIDTYQWQVLESGIWVDLTDTVVYSGTGTNTLSINTIQANGKQYRAELSNVYYACDPTEFSNIVTLNTKVNQILTNRRITYRVNKQ